jgi:FixJ family two-component response regulator
MAKGSGGKELLLEDADGMREAIETLLSAAGIESAAYASAEAPSRMPCASLATSIYLRCLASNC